MEIIKLEPQGFCGGVTRAIKLVNDALADDKIKKPIYMLGSIIHNEIVVNEFKKKGIIILNDKNKTKLEQLNNINEGSVILSAHGSEDAIYDLIKKKNLNLIDATCNVIIKIHNKIKDYLNKGYQIIYIGTANHPEADAVLSIDKNIIFITSINDLNNININNDKIYVTNQTTLSMIEINKIYDEIKNKYPNSIIDNKICLATTNRQMAILNQENVDLCIIVGDPLSSNSKKLYELSKNVKNINTIFCKDELDIDYNEIKKYDKISISSGASTPSYLVDKIINNLKK